STYIKLSAQKLNLKYMIVLLFKVPDALEWVVREMEALF
nr:hypothetical protein [Tanacetum cinerariifolium]